MCSVAGFASGQPWPVCRICTTTFPLLSNASSIDTAVIVTVSGHFPDVEVSVGFGATVDFVGLVAALVLGAAEAELLVDVDPVELLEVVDAVEVAELVLASAACAPSARRKLVAITAVVLRTTGRRKQKPLNLVPVMRTPV
jgi:hypothetical protein